MILIGNHIKTLKIMNTRDNFTVDVSRITPQSKTNNLENNSQYTDIVVVNLRAELNS